MKVIADVSDVLYMVKWGQNCFHILNGACGKTALSNVKKELSNLNL